MASKSINFEHILHHSPVGIYRSTTAQKASFVYSNPSLLKLLGYTQKELNKLSVLDIYADKKQYRQLLKRAIDEGTSQRAEIRIRNKNKRSFWSLVSVTVASEQSNKLKYIDVAIEDISDRKDYEKQLIDSKELFQTVFDNTAAAITVTDENECIVAWNPFTEEMLGMKKEELFNMPVKKLYPAKEWRRIRSFRIRRKGVLTDIETKVICSNQKVLDANVSISVLKDADEKIIGSVGIMRDITAQKIAEAKIKESENKIRIILDNSAVAITLIDDQERIISWNKHTEQMLGYNSKDLSLRPVKSMYPQEEWRRIRAENIRKIGSKHHLETKALCKDGQIIDVDLSINVLRDSDDKIIGSVGIMQDITEQKKFQEMLVQSKLAAEEANSAKSLFLANMSHEVRTPMNTIMGMIDLTLDTHLADEQKENLQVAKDAADNLLGLLNDILDLSRVEAGKITLENIEFHLPNVVKSVVKGLSVIARDKDLNLEIDIEPNVPELVEGDPVRLRQVLINLINNAIKFTHKGKITTRLSLSSTKGGEDLIHFAVEDEGIGIPKDRQDKIFEVFTQADTSTTRRFGGTGLGLAISKRLVEMMGGRIWVESEEARGSVFQFTAAFKVVSQKASADNLPINDQVDDIDQFISLHLKNINILLAEDNVVNQKIVIRVLEKKGWSVTAVTTGRDVLHKLDEKKFDLVLMDAHMPIMDGLEATQVLRQNEEKTGQHMPVIALTARAMQEDRKKCIDAGMDGYVAKPIDRRKLFEEIINVFKQRK